MLSLSKAVSNYLPAAESHTEAEGSSLIKVMNILERATIDEIITQINSLTIQNLWNPPLLDAFHDEMLSRLMSETTFTLFTVWVDPAQWSQTPYLTLRVGFEDSYLVVDSQGNYVDKNLPGLKSLIISNSSFPDTMAQKIIRLILNSDLTGEVVVNDTVDVVRIESVNDPTDGVNLKQNSGQGMKVPIKVVEDPDFNVWRRLYTGLKKSQPVVVDTYESVLINQLIDQPKAQEIHRTGGITFEGNLFLSLSPESDDDGEVPPTM